MAHSKLNLITPPDNLYNFNPGYLFVKPSAELKLDVKSFFNSVSEDINVFIFDENDTDIQWLLSCSRMSDIIIIDIDNCDELTKNFISFLLIHPRAFYITNDDDSLWRLISRNRIYEISDIIKHMDELDIDQEDEDF